MILSGKLWKHYCFGLGNNLFFFITKCKTAMNQLLTTRYENTHKCSTILPGHSKWSTFSICLNCHNGGFVTIYHSRHLTRHYHGWNNRGRKPARYQEPGGQTLTSSVCTESVMRTQANIRTRMHTQHTHVTRTCSSGAHTRMRLLTHAGSSGGRSPARQQHTNG